MALPPPPVYVLDNEAQPKLSDDPDYPAAKRSKNLAALLWLGALFLDFIIRPLLIVMSLSR